MKNESKIKALVESAILCAISVLIIVLSMYLPLFYILGYMILPIPFAYIQIKHGIRYSLMSLFAAGAVSAILVDPFLALSLIAVYGVVGVALGYSSKSKLDSFTTIALMTALLCIGTIIMYKLSVVVLGIDAVKQLTDAINQAVKSTKDMYTQMGIQDETINNMLNSGSLVKAMKMLIPSVVILSSLIVSFIIYKLTYKVFKKINNCSIPDTKPISEWFLSRGLTTVLLVLIIISYIASFKLGESGNIYVFNSFIVFSFAYIIQAIALLSFYCDKIHMAKAIKIILLILLIFSPFSYFLVFLGMIDYIVDFRKIGPRRIQK